MVHWISRSLVEVSRRLHAVYDKDLLGDIEKISEIAKRRLTDEFWDPETDRLVADLELSENLDELARAVQGVRDKLGLQHVTVLVVDEGAYDFTQCRMLTTMPQERIEAYVCKGRQVVDPTLCDPEPDPKSLWRALAELVPASSDADQHPEQAHLRPSGSVFWTRVSTGPVLAVVFTPSATLQGATNNLERLDGDLAVIAEVLSDAVVRMNGLELPRAERVSDEGFMTSDAMTAGALSPSPEDPSLGRLMHCALPIAVRSILPQAPLRMEDVILVDTHADAEPHREGRAGSALERHH